MSEPVRLDDVACEGETEKAIKLERRGLRGIGYRGMDRQGERADMSEERLMSILEVTEFAGKAQVMGAVRDVVVAGGRLEIRGITIGEAQCILNHLAVGLRSVKLPEPTTAIAPAEPKRGRAKASAAPPIETTSSETKVEPAPAVKPPVEDDLPGTLGQDGKGPQPGDNVVPFPQAEPVVDAQANAKPEAGVPPDADDTGLIAKLSGYRKLGDILAELHERGYTTYEQMLAICEKVQPQVPVLKTIPTLADRVKRARDTMLGDAGT